MPLFKKRPVVIEARQWDGTALGATPIIDWILEGGGSASYMCDSADCTSKDEDHSIAILTLEGTMRAGVGWWIIRGVEGEYYPCENAIFEKTYERTE